MPDSVAMKTDLTQEKHSAGPCGTVGGWHRPPVGSTALLQTSFFEKLDSRHIGAASLSSHQLGVPSLLFFTCVNTDPASLS